jgi:large subunit ribosomal protein L4e
MASRQVVRVFSSKNPNTVVDEVALPHVFLAPIRNDIVHFVFYNLNKNRRQAYAVNKEAGMLYAAESWGTGRAVARVPRVGGSGTHRSGQGAFGNMCRGGRMFNPTTTWRRWHRKVNLTQRRHAVASAVAASAVPSLVLARGHRINQLPEVPFVVDSLNFAQTHEVIELFNKFGLQEELEKVKETRKVRPGQGKYRNRRYKTRKGPLVVFGNEDNLIQQSARNIPGVELIHVDRLNLLQLAPGGHLGRLIVWTASAFKRLNHIFGLLNQPAQGKKGYVLQRPLLVNANLARIVNSNEVQSVVRPKQKNVQLHDRQKKNPLKNRTKMNFLNPYDKERRAAEKQAHADNKANRATRLQQKKVARKALRKNGRKFIREYNKQLNGANTRSEQDYKDYIKSLKVGKDAMKDAAVEEEEN